MVILLLVAVVLIVPVVGVLSEIGREVMRNPFELRAFSAQWIRGQLGTWQGIFLFEHRRAAHRRHVSLTIIGE